jgi:hypothetical protein
MVGKDAAGNTNMKEAKALKIPSAYGVGYLT